MILGGRKLKNEHLFYWVLSALLFGAGVVWSPIILGVFKDSKDVFETLSYIATIIAAGVAISALTSWKAQFRTERRYEELQNLREALNGLGMITRLLKAFADYHIEYRAKDGVKEKMNPRYQKDLDVIFLEWSGAVNRYSYCWRVCKPFLTVQYLNDLKSVSPDRIRKVFYCFKNDFRIAYELELDDSLSVTSHLRMFSKGLDDDFEAADAVLSQIVSGYTH